MNLLTAGFSCKRLTKEYATNRGPVAALADVSFTVPDHEFACVVGPSGCGKTTLLKLIAGLIRPTSGRVVFEDESADGRPRTALVFQEHGVLPWMNVLDNVAFGLELQGVGRRNREERAKSFISKIGLEKFVRNYPHELSVGMRQRVGIARAFVSDSPILLMDEPFGSLDAQTKLILQEDLLRIWKERQKSVVYVTHDIEEAICLGDRVLVMSGRPGRIREDIQIPLPRPRDVQAASGQEATEIKWHIWKVLKEEVEQSLESPSL